MRSGTSWPMRQITAIDAHDYLAFAMKSGAQAAVGDYNPGYATATLDGVELPLADGVTWPHGAKMCVSCDWLSLPLDEVANFTRWSQLGKSTCDRLAQDGPEEEDPFSKLIATPSPARLDWRMHERLKCGTDVG